MCEVEINQNGNWEVWSIDKEVLYKTIREHGQMLEVFQQTSFDGMKIVIKLCNNKTLDTVSKESVIELIKEKV